MNKPGSDPFSTARARMVDHQLRRRGIEDERVLRAMARVPRHRFVPDPFLNEAYDDHPLPIGDGQTISQPYIVALMTAALDLYGQERVLEIGTGSGYQTAILAELSAEVFTVERSAALSEGARARLAELGYRNVTFVVGDGTLGLPDQAPFSRILLTGSVPRLPQAISSQLGEGGILVLPAGRREAQDLVRVRRKGDDLAREDLGTCAFVPLIGAEGWREGTSC
jgi:protein-L-isoaspartate(D-aspartate) O-methyltransferase